MAVLGLRFCARAFSSCGERGPLFIAVRGPLTIVASLVAEHRLQTHRLSNCGSRAQLLRGIWDPPRPGLEPVSPALAGRFSTTAPSGKPSHCFLILSHDINESNHLRMYCNVLQLRWLDFIYVEILSLKIMIPAPHNRIQRCYILKMYRKKYEENTKSSISKLRCWEYIFSVRRLKLKTK